MNGLRANASLKSPSPSTGDEERKLPLESSASWCSLNDLCGSPGQNLLQATQTQEISLPPTVTVYITLGVGLQTPTEEADFLTFKE